MERSEATACGCYDPAVDPLRRDDVDAMRTTSPEEKARQAFELMRAGIQLKRTALRARHPRAAPDEIEAMLQVWLDADG